MVTTHKRKKASRIRGSRTAGWGFRQKHKGHGNRGGWGMAGSGKRGDHKKQFAVNLDTKKGQYFGKQGLTSRGTERFNEEKINLIDIKDNFFGKGITVIDLNDHKILGNGNGFKAEIIARTATKAAIKKMEDAGGKITLPAKTDDVPEEKSEAKEKVAKEKKEDLEKKPKAKPKKEAKK
ncbi:MAG: large subunit ribosomal protein L15 [Patescibacteria group bacterium]|jgi:large subunit ribosomal protein L15